MSQHSIMPGQPSFSNVVAEIERESPVLDGERCSKAPKIEVSGSARVGVFRSDLEVSPTEPWQPVREDPMMVQMKDLRSNPEGLLVWVRS